MAKLNEIKAKCSTSSFHHAWQHTNEQFITDLQKIANLIEQCYKTISSFSSFFTLRVHNDALAYYLRKIAEFANDEEMSAEDQIKKMIVETFAFYAYLLEEGSKRLASYFQPLIHVLRWGYVLTKEDKVFGREEVQVAADIANTDGPRFSHNQSHAYVTNAPMGSVCLELIALRANSGEFEFEDFKNDLKSSLISRRNVYAQRFTRNKGSRSNNNFVGAYSTHHEKLALERKVIKPSRNARAVFDTYSAEPESLRKRIPDNYLKPRVLGKA